MTHDIYHISIKLCHKHDIFFTIKGTIIYLPSQKQKRMAPYVEMIALHKENIECVWMRSISRNILSNSGSSVNMKPNILYEDNAACITQTNERYIANVVLQMGNHSAIW